MCHFTKLRCRRPKRNVAAKRLPRSCATRPTRSNSASRTIIPPHPAASQRAERWHPACRCAYGFPIPSNRYTEPKGGWQHRRSDRRAQWWVISLGQRTPASLQCPLRGIGLRGAITCCYKRINGLRGYPTAERELKATFFQGPAFPPPVGSALAICHQLGAANLRSSPYRSPRATRPHIPENKDRNADHWPVSQSRHANVIVGERYWRRRVAPRRNIA